MAPKRSASKSRKSRKPETVSSPGWIQFAVLAVLLAAAGALWVGRDYVSAVVAGVTGSPTSDKPGGKADGKGVPVVVASVGETRDDAIVGAIGTGRARQSVMLFPDETGEVQHVFVSAGDRIEKGQPVMRLDSRKAELAVRVAKTKLIETERTLARAQQLREKKISSQANVDDARNLVDRAELELQQAEEALADHEIKAPFDGVVGIPKVERGDRVSPTMAVLSIDDRSELVVEFEVPEQFLARLKGGQKVEAHTPSYREKVFEGIITHIDSRIEPTSRTVTVRASISNKDDLLRPGMSFVVDLTIPGNMYPSVPELALQWRKGESFVWRIRNGKAERVRVRSVKRLNSIILVSGDIAKGDMVVIEGVHRLRPGRAVRFAEPGAAPSS
ncbi:MAG: efflux RND transporter periplasmic adaptor subunit [Hyphomicrobiaceae bacterium]|nr:efflux RND transporter periplasmic adaptor subunit [Hyphomicrobiaceae bacterium]